MRAGLFGLVGAVVGALLGGGAQLIAAGLQDKRRHQQWLRERRADVYQAFLADAEDRLRVLGDYFDNDPSQIQGAPEDYVVPTFGKGVQPTGSAAGDRGRAGAGDQEVRESNQHRG